MDVDEDDPIVASYPVFLNTPLPSTRRVLVLQHTSQKPEHLDTRPFTPLEVRLKPRSGMVEVDNPMETLSAYDREKGLSWGLKLSASTAAKSGGSHGLPGGFGVGAPPPRPKRRPEGELEDDLCMDWNTAVARDKVLRLQTLGGQIPSTKEAEYMIGVFQGKGLHLTPVTSMVNLRPQLHHIDAEAQEAQQNSRAQAAAASKDGAAPAANGMPIASGTPGAPRAIHMTIKNAGDGDGDTTETMADRLRAVQTEPWRKHSVIREAEEGKWSRYYDGLALTSKTGGDEDMDVDGIDDGSLEEYYGRLETTWGEQELLEAVSGFKKEMVVVEIKDEDDKGNVEAALPARNMRQSMNRIADVAAAESEVPRRGRVRGRTAAPRRGGKPRVSKGGSSAAVGMTDA